MDGVSEKRLNAAPDRVSERNDPLAKALHG